MIRPPAGTEHCPWSGENVLGATKIKASSYRVNESHILSLKRSRTEGPHTKGDVLNITVQDYLNEIRQVQNKLQRL